MMKKQSASLISKLLNKNSQPIQDRKNAEEIIMRDVHELMPNPKNEKYSLDNIEELAMMIQLTHNIEPIILGVHQNTVYKWIRLYNADPEHAFPGSGNLKPDEDELKKANRRIHELENEIAILKQAAVYFAKNSR